MSAEEAALAAEARRGADYVKRAREAFTWDVETGMVRWRHSNRRRRAGDEAGRIVRGYRKIRFCRLEVRAHRLIWALHYGEWPPGQIDHINGVKADNRICNLRLSDTRENQQNIHAAQSHSKSGLRGVSWYAPSGRWKAAIRMAGGQEVYLGYYGTVDEARAAYLGAKWAAHKASGTPPIDYTEPELAAAWARGALIATNVLWERLRSVLTAFAHGGPIPPVPVRPVGRPRASTANAPSVCPLKPRIHNDKGPHKGGL